MPATEVPFAVAHRAIALVLAVAVVLLIVPSLRERLGWLPVLVVVAAFRPVPLGGPTSFAIISGISMEPVMHTGDLAILVRQQDYREGDIVAYSPSQVPESLIIHRVVGGDARVGYVIRGDNRASNDYDRPKPSDVVGRAVVVIPSVGWFFAGLRLPVLLGLFVAIVAMWVAWDLLPEPKKEEGLT